MQWIAPDTQVFQQFLAALAILATVISVYAQPAPNLSTTASSPAPAQPNSNKPSAIPLAEVATNAETVSARLREILAQLSPDPITESVTRQLPVLTREIAARLPESRRIIAQRPSVEILGSVEAEWRRLRRNLSSWTADLTTRAARIEREIAVVDGLGKTWNETREAAKKADAPPEVLRRIEAVIEQIQQSRKAIEELRARVLTLQSRVAVQDTRIADILTSIRQAREDVLNRLFVKDGPAIWNAELRSHTLQNVLEETQRSLSTQWAELSIYFERQTIRFFLHAAIFIAFAVGLCWAKRRMQQQVHQTDSPSKSPVFEMPIASALLLSILCRYWLYPQAPRLLWAILVAVAFVPSLILFRRLLERDLYPTLYALIVFYCVDQLRTLTAAVQFLPRVLFLTEMVGVMLFLVWLYRSMERPTGSMPERLRKAIKIGACITFVVAILAFVGNILGYVALANLLGNSVLGSTYFAFVLYAVIEVLDGLVIIGLRLSPLRLFGIVQRHGWLLRHRLRQGLQWLAISLWLLFVLDRLLLREPALEALRRLLTAELAVGSLQISLGDVVAFVITVWAALVVSRFARFLLDEDVYPRIHLRRGLTYTISTLLHYVILLVGFFIAVAALGVDMTRITILAGAFSVGVGFGLQNIFNNFISGLILLFEHPVNVGDIIQIDDAAGVVEHIGIRASIIRTQNGSEIIIPNGKLISERLTNWTLSNRQRSIELAISVARENDPNRVVAILEQTAGAQPLVCADPSPQALVVSLDAGSLLLQLRCSTDRIEQWMQVRSEVAIAVNAALAREKIALR